MLGMDPFIRLGHTANESNRAEKWIPGYEVGVLLGQDARGSCTVIRMLFM
jgi:hypothetical protein